MKRVLLLATLAAFARPCAAGGLACPAGVLDPRGYGAVPLFTALPLGRSAFAKQWAKALPALSKEFPGLRFEKPENLHVTLVFISTAGWDSTRLDEIEKHALDGPDVSSAPLVLQGGLDTFGPKKDVAVLHLAGVPDEWRSRLMKDRQTLTDQALRPRDRYDDVFEAHVSLAFAADPVKQRPELLRFELWMADHAKSFGGLRVAFGRDTAPATFLVLGKGETTRFLPIKAYCR